MIVHNLRILRPARFHRRCILGAPAGRIHHCNYEVKDRLQLDYARLVHVRFKDMGALALLSSRIAMNVDRSP